MTERSPSGAPDRRRSGSPFEEGPVMSEDQKLLAVLRHSPTPRSSTPSRRWSAMPRTMNCTGSMRLPSPRSEGLTKNAHRRLSARLAPRPVRDVLERALSRLRRRARGRHEPQDRSTRANIAARSAPPATSRPSTRWSRSPSRSARGCARSRPTIPNAAHVEYMRQIFWGSGVDLPEDFERLDRGDRA